MEKIALLLNNSINALSRKFDLLAMELRNKKQPDSRMNVSIPDNVADAIGSAMKEGLKNLKVPAPMIHIPDQKAPVVNVPAPIVKIEAPKAPIVNVPPANITVEPAPVNFPESMKIEGMDKLLESVNRDPYSGNIFDEVSSKKPLPIIVMDAKGKQVTNFGGDFSAPSTVALRTGTTPISATNPLPVAEGFQLDQYDYISLSYTGDNLTGVVYKTGGASGTTVATLTLAYSGSTLTSVTKS